MGRQLDPGLGVGELLSLAVVLERHRAHQQCCLSPVLAACCLVSHGTPIPVFAVVKPVFVVCLLELQLVGCVCVCVFDALF